MRSLVVYYTRTGNTKFVAETIAAELGSDIEELVDLKKREGKLGWLSAGRDSSGEKLTEIAPTTRTPADYDLIVVGSPVWAWRPTPAIRTYFKQNDLSGKKIALFFTLDGSPKQCVEKTKAIIPNSTIIDQLVMTKPLENKEDSMQKIAEWCSTLQNQTY